MRGSDSPNAFPGEGRGPVVGPDLAGAPLRHLNLSTWAPAFAGEAIFMARAILP